MFANIARLSRDVSEAKRIVNDFGKDATRVVEGVKSAFAALGVGLSVGGFTALIRSSIDAMDHINDLSKATGVAVEQLAGLKVAAKQSGSDLEGAAASINKLAQNMGKNAEKFAALGVSARDPLQALEQLADQFVAIQDPQLRAAAMAEALGKKWQGAAPLLAEGGKRIAEMVDEGSKLSSVTAEAARQADEFNDKLVKLTGTGGLVNQQVSAVLPLLNALADDLLAVQAAARQGGGGFDILLESLRAVVVLGGNVAFVLKGIGTEIGVIAAQIGALAEAFTSDGMDGLQRFAQIHEQATADAQKAREEFDAWEKKILTVGTAADTASKQIATLNAAMRGEYGDQASRRAASEAAGRARAFLAPKSAPAVADDSAFKTERAALEKEIAQLERVGEMEAYLKKLEEDRFASLTPEQEAELKRLKEKLIELKNEHEARQMLLASSTALIQEMERQNTIEESMRVSNREALDQMQFEISLIGKTAAEQEKLNAMRKIDLDLRKQIEQVNPDAGDSNSPEQSARILRLMELAEKQKAATTGLLDQKRALEEQLTVWNELGNIAGRFFSDLITHGRGAFDGLKQMIRQLLAEMTAIFAKRWILQLAAGATGSAALSAQASAVGQNTVAGAANSMIGSALGGLNQWGGSLIGASTFTGGISSAIFGTGALTGAGDFVGTGLAGWAGNMAMAAGATDAFAATVAAAVPVIGWIVAIGAVLFSMFGSKGGGPKAGGSFMGAFNSFGAMVSNPSVPGTDNGRFFTPSQSDRDLATMGRAVGTGFADTLRSLGGRAGSVQFGFGFDTDPNGTAQNRVSATASVNGQTVYNVRDRGVGRDADELQRQLKLESMRAMLAALQASDLPVAIKAWLKTLDASTASETEIQNLLKGAAALKTLIDDAADLDQAIAALADPTGVTAITNQLKNLDKAVTDALDALNVAQNKNDPQAFLAAERQYRQAVMNRYQQEINMVRQLQASIRQVEESAYQFAINIAQRINAVGGSVNIGGLALGRAGTLRSRIEAGKQPTQFSIEDLNGYVSAIDTWYSARRDAIMRDAEAQAAAQQAIAQAQQSAAQARVQQLQGELAQVQNMKAVIDQAAKMSKEMQLSAENPLHALGRFQLAKADVGRLRAEFEAASGADKATAGQKLLEALQSERGLLGAFQRPSGDYIAAYNQIQADLALVQKDAKTIDQQQLELTAKIAQEQERAASYGAVTADATSIARSSLAALDAEARSYYTWAQGEGVRLYNMQREAYQRQLMAATGGSDPELWIANKTTEMRDLLVSIDSRIANFLLHVGDSAGGNITTDNGPKPRPSDGITKSGSASITINVQPGEDVVDALLRQAPRVKRALARA